MLSVRDLVVEFDSPRGPLIAVDHVSFDVYEGEVLCIVGESGSGKSLTMLAVMGLLPETARISGGSIRFRGRELIGISDADAREFRGRDLAMIFQDPMTSLNPVMRIGKQIAEMVRLHRRDLSRAQVRDRVIELLELVRIPNPRQRARNYPHEFSGGMRQRAMIAMSMAHNPAILIADEPTTALDVTIQAQILTVLRQVREESGSSLVLITHDLGVVAEVADRVVVLYGGRVMETGTVFEIFEDPRHPYTAGLLASSLTTDRDTDVAYAVPGQTPTLDARPSGCVFHPRCGLGAGRTACADKVPAYIGAVEGRREAACHFSDEVRRWAAEVPDIAAQLDLEPRASTGISA